MFVGAFLARERATSSSSGQFDNYDDDNLTNGFASLQAQAQATFSGAGAAETAGTGRRRRSCNRLFGTFFLRWAAVFMDHLGLPLLMRTEQIVLALLDAA